MEPLTEEQSPNFLKLTAQIKREIENRLIEFSMMENSQLRSKVLIEIELYSDLRTKFTNYLLLMNRDKLSGPA